MIPSDRFSFAARSPSFHHLSSPTGLMSPLSLSLISTSSSPGIIQATGHSERIFENRASFSLALWRNSPLRSPLIIRRGSAKVHLKAVDGSSALASDGSLGNSSQGSPKSRHPNELIFPTGFEALVLDVCDETNIAELKLKVGDFEMYLKRDISVPVKESSSSTALSFSPPSTETQILQPPELPPKLSSVKDSKLAVLEASGSIAGYAIVSSPTVGTFQGGRTVKGIRQPPSCKEGSVIKEGQVICYLDQFGNDLPIKSNVAGEVLQMLFKDGEPVGYGDPLAVVLPSFHGIK